jgi:hypothetical protein
MTTTSTSVAADVPTVPTRRTRWFAGLSALLLVVGLGIGFVLGRVTEPEVVLPQDLADSTVTAMLDDFMRAVNEGDEARLADMFATDATFTDTTKDDGYVVEGNTAIAEGVASWHVLGFQVWDPGTTIHNGDFVARYHVSSVGPVMAVYELQEGKFQNVWIVRP